jgi:RNA polymerase sigma-70 factor (ECF subfamily)
MKKLQEAQQRILLATAHRDFVKGLSQHSFYKLGNQALGDDLVQDTFIKTWSYLVKGGKIDTMKAFLYHVLNNLIIDEYRKRKTVSLDVLLEKGYEPQSKDSDRLVSMIDSKEILVFIKKLPERYQKAIKMRYIQDLSLKEMSLLTGQTQNAMAVQVHRGLAQLKKLYESKPIIPVIVT